MVEGRRCVLGVDLGAGAMKVSVLDESGRDLASVSQSYPTHSPHPGWSEQDPEDWWIALCRSVPAALQAAKLKGTDIAAVGFSAGTHSPVLVDSVGRLVRPAILWSDQRSGAEARELQERHGEEILNLALNWPTPTWTLCQFLWLRHHEPNIVAKVARLMMPKDWLRWRLCGEWHTDVTDAVGTLMWDHAAAGWSARLCEMIDWPIDTLPPVVAPATIVGRVTSSAASASGLAPGTPLICGTSDTSAEAYAAGADVGGAGVVKLATAATVSLVGTAPFVHRTLINYPFAIPGLWYTITATNSCASAHRWLRDNFFMRPGDDGSAVFAQMDDMATRIAVGSDGLLFHPYLLGERAPYWDPLLRGDFLGMTMRHTRAHFVRALYEGIALSLRDVLGEFRAQGIDLQQVRIIGGGSRSATWRQIVADVLGVRVELPERTDASCGVALLAAVAAGVHADERAARSHGAAACAVHEPQPTAQARYTELHDLYRQSAQQLRDLNHALSAFERRYA